MRGTAMAALAMILGLVGSGCDESDATSIRIRLKSDLSGTLVVSAIAVPTEASALERGVLGVTWNDRLQMSAVSGSFESLSKLVFEDITFRSSTPSDPVRWVEATLRRNPDVRWVKAIVPLPAAERKRLGPIFDPAGDVGAIGVKIKLQIDLPSRAVAHGVAPLTPGVKEDAEGAKVTLLVPVDNALLAGPDLVWHVTWKQ